MQAGVEDLEAEGIVVVVPLDDHIHSHALE
jgi:hypothetical protein